MGNRAHAWHSTAQQDAAYTARTCTAVSGESPATKEPVTAVITATTLMVSWNCTTVQRGAGQAAP